MNVARWAWQNKPGLLTGDRVFGGTSSPSTELRMPLVEAGDMERGEPFEEVGLAPISLVVRRGLGGGVL